MSVSGQVKDHVVPTCTNAVLQMWLWPATDREPHCRHLLPLTTFEGGLNLLHEAHDDAVIYTAGIYSDCSTREVINLA